VSQRTRGVGPGLISRAEVPRRWPSGKHSRRRTPLRQSDHRCRSPRRARTSPRSYRSLHHKPRSPRSADMANRYQHNSPPGSAPRRCRIANRRSRHRCCIPQPGAPAPAGTPESHRPTGQTQQHPSARQATYKLRPCFLRNHREHGANRHPSRYFATTLHLEGTRPFSNFCRARQQRHFFAYASLLRIFSAFRYASLVRAQSPFSSRPVPSANATVLELGCGWVACRDACVWFPAARIEMRLVRALPIMLRLRSAITSLRSGNAGNRRVVAEVHTAATVCVERFEALLHSDARK